MRAADVADLLKGLATDVREFVAKSVAKFEERFAAIEQRLQAAPDPLSPDAATTLAAGQVERWSGAVLEPRLESIMKRLAAAEERAPIAGAPGERGEPGPRGDAGEPGARGLEGAPGKDVDEAALQLRIDETVAKGIAAAMATIPVPKDGAAGKDGQDGRDALQIELLDMIDPAKSYPRGTYACWSGGIVRSFRATDALVEGERIEKAGWTLAVDGVASVTAESMDDPRNFAIRLTTTSNKTVDLPFSMPTPIWRGIWTEREFERGDLVTYDGSVWHCERPTKAKPGTQASTPDWKLCTKKGRDGRDGEKGPKGDRGEDGRPGRDLTQMMPDGSKF